MTQLSIKNASLETRYTFLRSGCEGTFIKPMADNYIQV